LQKKETKNQKTQKHNYRFKKKITFVPGFSNEDFIRDILIRSRINKANYHPTSFKIHSFLEKRLKRYAFIV
jgi:hypothetical protein